MSERGKVGIGAIVVCAAVGYALWQWGLPWIDAQIAAKREETAKKVPEAPAAQTPDAPSKEGAPAPAVGAGLVPALGGGNEPAATPEGVPASSAGTPAPVDPREAAARKLLNEARNWETNKRYETARAKYEELIEVYKGTQAAEEARPLLEALRSK